MTEKTYQIPILSSYLKRRLDNNEIKMKSV